MMTTIPAS